jgi:hypothetical protein
MPVQTLSFPWPSKRFVIRGAVAASLATLAAVAMAQEFPVFRKGLWEFNRTVDGGGTGKTQTMTTKKCADPTNDMKKQNACSRRSGVRSLQSQSMERRIPSPLSATCRGSRRSQRA